MSRTTVAMLLAAAILTGCFGAQTSRMYSRNHVNTAWTVEYGAVTQIRDITIEGRGGPIGTYGGGYIGHEAGRAVGSGTGSNVAGAAGAVIGAVAGHMTEKKVTERKGYEITVELDPGNKKSIAVIQVADEQFAVGERVKVLRRGDEARVTKA